MAKKKNNEGERYRGGKEHAVLKAWKRGERTAEEVAKITKLPLETVYKYIPV